MITKFLSDHLFKNQKFIFLAGEIPTTSPAEIPNNAEMTVQDVIDGITKEIGRFDPKLLENILDPNEARTANVLQNAKKGKKSAGIQLKIDYILNDKEKENLRGYGELQEKVIAAKKEREQSAAVAEARAKTTEISTDVARENVESYTVEKGDTLSKIAKKYHTTARAIYDYNVAQNPKNWQGRNINKLKVNETILVPKPGALLLATVREAEKTAEVGEILDQPRMQIQGMRETATARDVSPERKNHEALGEAIRQSLLSSIDHTLSASTKFQEYAQEARRMALSENNIEEHGWLKFKHDSGLLGIFTNGNEDDVIRRQQEYWLTNLDTSKKGAGWETGRLLRDTVISSAAATAVDNLTQLAIYGAIPEAIPVTIL
ncbi:LysM peptidoglycan-binding domain-containing protein, partial [Candidatus Peregrinibacteria bacterium]|nr:LysM peptidoglycan-binding domain-containing protein [Candidatus Peregrinibacteria bacterium]